LKFEQIG